MAAAMRIRPRWSSSCFVSVSDRIVSSLLAIVLSLGCISTISASADDDASEVRGSWRAKSATRNGQPAEDVVGHRLVCHKERFEIRAKDGAVLYKGTYQVQRDELPRTIDFRHSGKALKGTTWKGIYERKSNRLRICDNAPDTKKSRPENFEAPRNSGYLLIVFDRIK